MNTDITISKVYDLLGQNINLGIVILCLVIGFLLKHTISRLNNNWIPVILLVFGIIFAVVLDFANLKDNAMQILITGIASGAMAIGIHQSGKTIFINDKTDGNGSSDTIAGTENVTDKETDKGDEV